jgi:hypothetical protein
MRGPITDLMAGERARAIRSQPGAFHPIVDPTDPRCRHGSPDSGWTSVGSQPIFDPTDPEYGRVAERGQAPR